MFENHKINASSILVLPDMPSLMLSSFALKLNDRSPIRCFFLATIKNFTTESMNQILIVRNFS